MSDISTLSHEYETNALFADKLNSLVLKLKKYILRTIVIDDKEITVTRKKLTELLDGIVLGLTAKEIKDENTLKLAGKIPAEILEQLQEHYKNKMQYYIEDLQDFNEKLKSNKELDSKKLEILDSLCDLSDSVASTSFRRLWRR